MAPKWYCDASHAKINTFTESKWTRRSENCSNCLTSLNALLWVLPHTLETTLPPASEADRSLIRGSSSVWVAGLAISLQSSQILAVPPFASPEHFGQKWAGTRLYSLCKCVLNRLLYKSLLYSRHHGTQLAVLYTIERCPSFGARVVFTQLYVCTWDSAQCPLYSKMLQSRMFGKNYE